MKLNLSPGLVPPYVSSYLTLAGLTYTPGGSHKSESGWLLLCFFAAGTWQVLLNFSELQFSHLQNGRNDAYLIELQGRRNEEIKVEVL